MQVACARTYVPRSTLDSLDTCSFCKLPADRSWLLLLLSPLREHSSSAAARQVSPGPSLVLCTVACLDCAPRRNLSLAGVLVAVKCANGTGLRAAETDGRGRFEVPVPAAAHRGSGSGSGFPQCASRILGGPEQLCAPPRFATSRIVVAGRERGRPGKHSLASRLAVFTRCAATNTATATGADGATLTMEGLPGIDSPLDYNMGLPLNLFFPFFPVIGGGIP